MFYNQGAKEHKIPGPYIWDVLKKKKWKKRKKGEIKYMYLFWQNTS